MNLDIHRWRKHRNRAGVLQYLLAHVRDGRQEEAEKIYRQWLEGKITFKEAKIRIERLLKK